ncbi:MAG: O-antigen ligase family protein [Clostridia bacterium]|nr:O-antigen ligase family protein [Clostridia bacterium]
MSKTKDVCAFLRKNRVTERLFCVLLAIFPLVHALPHTTWTVGLAIGVLLASHAAARGIGGYRARSAFEWSIVVLIVMLILYGALGHGSFLDGAAVALMLAAYFPAREVLSDARGFRRACVWTAAGVGVTTLCGVAQYFFGNLTVRWVDMRMFSDIGGRVTAFFDNPNVLAIYLLFAFPLTLIGAADGESRGACRVLCYASAAATVACCLLTWTRGAWLGMILQGILFLILCSRRTRRALWLFPLLLPVAAFVLPPQVLRRFQSIGSLADSSNLYRIHTWRGVLRMIAAHPLGIGVGERAFRAVYPAHAVMGTETVMHAHNVFLQVTVELGIVGGGLLLFTVFAALLTSRKSLGSFPLAGLAVMGLFDHLWYAPSMACLFAVALAFAAAIPRNDTERQENVSILHEKL